MTKRMRLALTGGATQLSRSACNKVRAKHCCELPLSFKAIGRCQPGGKRQEPFRTGLHDMIVVSKRNRSKSLM